MDMPSIYLEGLGPSVFSEASLAPLSAEVSRDGSTDVASRALSGQQQVRRQLGMLASMIDIT
jgi:hypothetical protein